MKIPISILPSWNQPQNVYQFIYFIDKLHPFFLSTSTQTIYSISAVQPLCLHTLPLLYKQVINHLGSSTEKKLSVCLRNRAYYGRP
jgi:hypothetical protein